MDRETKEVYEIIIKATEDCNTIPKNQTTFNEKDDTLLKVTITVNDINDNAPKFISETFTGGVTTDADFATEFMQVKVNKINR